MSEASEKGLFGRWQDRRAEKKAELENQSGMDYLVSLPKRLVYVYLPLSIIVFVLLFPFYWMTITAIKPNEQLVNLDLVNPYWVVGATLDHIKSLLFDTPYLHWMWNTMFVALVATFLSLVASVLAAYAIVRLRYRGAQTIGGLIFLAYLVPPSILFIPLSLMVVKYGLWDSPWSLILTYPTILIPFSTWLLMGYFKSIPYELEECALIDGATRWEILTKIVLPLSGPGLISAGIFCFTLCWNEFIYALTFISTPANKTVPVAILSEMVDGDVYRWGSLMAGALFGSIPVALVYMFFVNHYVSAMTGAVKE
jgi:multiple sugar transport system permease protein